MMVLSHEMRVSLSHALDRAVEKALSSTIKEPSYRVFKSNSLDYVLCSQVPREWSKHEASCSSSKLKSICGNEAVLVVNDVASWDAELCSLTKYLNKYFGIDGEIIDTYTFISSSPMWTPFGAHVDFEDSFILDVAGKGRDIYIWKEGENIGQIINQANHFFGISFEYNSYIEKARKVTIQPGQFCLIRELEPHVFFSKGSGMFFGLSIVKNKDNRKPPISPRNDPDIENYIRNNLYKNFRWSDKVTLSRKKISHRNYSIEIEEYIFDNFLESTIGNTFNFDYFIRSFPKNKGMVFLKQILKIDAIYEL